MGLIWRCSRGTSRYEVRSAGRAVRLYSNGVFHSQWNPARPLSGSVWDLLSLPALFLRQSKPRVLVLGLGGGAVVRQLAVLKPGSRVIAVDLDPVHIQVANRWFGVDEKAARLCLADARHWMKSYRGERFDLIVDDLFGHSGGEASRAVAVDDSWAKTLATQLQPGGVLVVNHAAESQWRCRSLRRAGFCHRRKATLPLYDNVIGVYRRRPLSLTRWQEQLTQCRGLSASQRHTAARGCAR